MNNEVLDLKEIVSKSLYKFPSVYVDEKVLECGNSFYTFEKSQRKLNEISDFCKTHSVLSEKYDLIDLDFLRMRRPDKTPVFAVFTSKKEKCQIGVELSEFVGILDFRVYLNNNFNSRLIASKYKDVYADLIEKALLSCQGISIFEIGKLKIELTSDFNGVLPSDIRQLMQSFTKFEGINSRVFDEVVMIAEAESWTQDSVITYYPPNPDPLIVGIKDSVAYLIASFDTTRMEDYVKKEFTF